MDIIARLNKLRLEKNMSVYRLAEISGVNQSTLANTFSRGNLPSLANLELLCDAFGITLSQFFNESETTVEMSAEELEFFQKLKTLPKDVQDSIKEIVNSVLHAIYNQS